MRRPVPSSVSVSNRRLTIISAWELWRYSVTTAAILRPGGSPPNVTTLSPTCEANAIATHAVNATTRIRYIVPPVLETIPKSRPAMADRRPCLAANVHPLEVWKHGPQTLNAPIGDAAESCGERFKILEFCQLGNRGVADSRAIQGNSFQLGEFGDMLHSLVRNAPCVSNPKIFES